MTATDNNQKMTIAAVIPAYNAEQYIGRAIDSVLAQTVPVNEIVIVDDGSTDKTAEIIQSYGDQVRYVRQDNGGECAARNTGIQEAKSDWIAFLDADDEWLEDKIKLQTDVVRQNPFLVWVTSNYNRCLCGKNIRRQNVLPEKANAFLRGKHYYEDFFQAFLIDAYGCSNTMLVKKEVLIQSGLFRVGQTRAGDMDMWWRIAFRWPQIGYVQTPLAVYHLGIDTCASVVFQDRTQYIEMIERNIEIAAELEVSERFLPAAVQRLKLWIRSWLFEGQKSPIHCALKRFRHLLSPQYRAMIYMLTVFPKATSCCLKLVSKAVRATGLRKKLVR
jgi:glycosyltransferase involved in cell wall biosynthesis